jgi:hypothetical protein
VVVLVAACGGGPKKLAGALRWELTYGAEAEALKKADTKAWRERTEVFDDLRWIWAGWMRLTTSRQVNAMGGFGGICPSDIAAFLDLTGVCEPERREQFTAGVFAMEAVFLEYVRSKREESDRGSQSVPRPGARPDPAAKGRR